MWDGVDVGLGSSEPDELPTRCSGERRGGGEGRCMYGLLTWRPPDVQNKRV